jgi:hypothetical protein
MFVIQALKQSSFVAFLSGSKVRFENAWSAVLKWSSVLLRPGLTINCLDALSMYSIAQVSALQAENARLQELVAVRARETKLLKRKLQLDIASSNACGHLNGDPKRQRVHHSSSTCSCSLEGASPLDKDEMLDQIFSYVGGRDHLYIAGVSRKWRGRYLHYCALSSTSKVTEKLVTRHRSALMTESRLQLALTSEFTVEGWTFCTQPSVDLICKHSTEPKQVMTLFRLHGVPWDKMLCTGAAANAKLALLQWLRRSSCPWNETHVLLNASRGGSAAMLKWLLTVTAVWPAALQQKMLVLAAYSDHLEAARWLRERDAQWPTKFAGQLNTVNNKNFHTVLESSSSTVGYIIRHRMA